MVLETGMFEPATVSGLVNAEQEETFYVRHGDIIGWGSLIGGLLVVVAAFAIPGAKKKAAEL
jgi:hypothetical protein